MYSTELGINFFGNESNKKRQLNKIEILKKNINNFKIFLVIAGTNTSQIPGISAAGINAKSRRTTALADAEFLLEGASKNHKYKLPLLNAGVTPALRRGNLYLWFFEAPSSKNSASASAVFLLDFALMPAAEIP